MNRRDKPNKETPTLTRRNVLLAASVPGTVGLAGCSGVTNQSFTASDVQMGEAGAELGFEQGEGRTFTNSQEREVAGVEGSVTAESKLTVFSNAESTPDPTEEERWADSDSTLSQWSENTPVRAVPGSDVMDGDILPAEGDQFESMPAESTTVLVPDTEGEPDSVVSVTPLADIDFGDRVAGDGVAFDPPVPYVEGESFAPAGLAFISEDGQ